MGSSPSKPAEGQSYVWRAPGPIGVSQDVVESLEGTSESDASRAQTLELAVQARVAAELKKLSTEATDVVHRAAEKALAVSDEEARQQEAAHASKQAVSAEVEALRARLDKRKQLRELPDSVERARGAVVQCLIANDRRPLNCYDEVQAFKHEVRRLEKEWVDKVVR